MRVAAVVALAAVALLAPACGPADDIRVEPARPRLEAHRPWSTDEEVRVATLPVPEGLEPWTWEATRMELERRPEEEGGALAVRLGANEAKRVAIPLEPGHESFNRVACTVLLARNSSVMAELRADGRVIARSPWALVIGGKRPQVVTTDLLSARVLDIESEELVLVFAGGARWATCWDVELLRRPWESWVAELGRDSGRTAVGGVTREAAPIATDNGRTAEFEVPEDGRLVVHAAHAPDLATAGHPSTLDVRVFAGGDRVEAALELDAHVPGEERWSRLVLDLSRLAGERARAEFTLRSPGKRPDYALLARPTIHVPDPDPRTVLFVTSDTHRADHVAGARGAVNVLTPALEALGERGVVFDDCYSSTNITVPSHVALFTAAPSRDSGVVDNVSGISEAAPTLAERFRDEGWATLAAVSGSQLQDEWSGLGQGFDAMACPSTGTWDGAETTRALFELTEEAEDRDLFVWLHLFDAHRPYEERETLIPHYWDESRDPYSESIERSFPRGILTGAEHDVRDAEYMDARYRAEVSYVDEVLADVLVGTRFADGWIAFTADHGECLGEYSVWWDHAGLYPENLHVPLILAGPGVPEGRRVSGPVQHIDLGRTVLDLAGLEDAPFPGETMLRWLEREPDADTPRFAFAWSNAKTASVEMDGWFCVLNLRSWRLRGQDADKPAHSVELYDLRGGAPQENVADEHVERASRMRRMILDWLARQEDTGWVQQDRANDAVRLQEVQALGYTTDTSDGASEWIDPACDCEPCRTFGFQR